MNFRSLFVQQFNLMIHKKGFQFSSIVMLCICGLSFIQSVKMYQGIDTILIPPANELVVLFESSPYSLAVPQVLCFLVLFPFASSLVNDKNLKIIDIYLSKVSMKMYYWCKALVCMVGTFIVVYIPLIINQILVYFTFRSDTTSPVNGVPGSEVYMWHIIDTPDEIYALNGNNKYGYLSGILMPGLYTKNSFVYYLAWGFLVAFVASLLALFIYAVSCFVRKYAIILLIPVYALVTLIGSVWIYLDDNQSITTQFSDYLVVSIVRNKFYPALLIFLMILVAISFVLIHISSKKDQLQ